MTAREWERADVGSDPDPGGDDDDDMRLFAALEKLVSATADDAETETNTNANANARRGTLPAWTD